MRDTYEAVSKVLERAIGLAERTEWRRLLDAMADAGLIGRVAHAASAELEEVKNRQAATREAEIHADDSDAERTRAMAVLKSHREFTHRIAELAGIEPTNDESILKAIESNVERMREHAKATQNLASWRPWQELLVAVVNTLGLPATTNLVEATKAVGDIRVRHDKMRVAHAALVNQVALLGGLGTGSDAPDMITETQAVAALDGEHRRMRCEMEADAWLRVNAIKTLGLPESASRQEIMDAIDQADEQRERYSADKLMLRSKLDRAEELLASSRAQCDRAQSERLKAERALSSVRSDALEAKELEWVKAEAQRAAAIREASR